MPASTIPTDVERVRALGVIDLPTLQKKANLHFSLTLDLFGNEISTNAANAFNAGLKGRYREDKLTDDHVLTNATYPVLRLRDGAIVQEDVPALSALNMRLRDDLRGRCQRRRDAVEPGVRAGRDCVPPGAAARRIQSPHRRVRAGAADPEGRVIDADAWAARRDEWLPSPEDAAFIDGLMRTRAGRGQLRLLDRAAEGGHRQPARRLRVREAARVIFASLGGCLLPRVLADKILGQVPSVRKSLDTFKPF